MTDKEKKEAWFRTWDLDEREDCLVYECEDYRLYSASLRPIKISTLNPVTWACDDIVCTRIDDSLEGE